MLHLIQPLLPKPLHRLALRLGYRALNAFRRRFKRPCAGVSLIARDGAGRVLLVRHSYSSGRWTLPGGGLGRGEDPHEAAHRELREELGCRADCMELIGTIQGTLSGAPHTAHLFAFEVRGTPRPDGREVLEAQFFDPAALPPDIGPVALDRIRRWRKGGG